MEKYLAVFEIYRPKPHKLGHRTGKTDENTSVRRDEVNLAPAWHGSGQGWIHLNAAPYQNR